MTARGGTPSPSWERWVVTGKARARIRRYVAQQQRAQTVENGKATLTRAFRQDGLDGSEKVLETALKPLKCNTLEDLYAAVGAGTIGPKDVVFAAYPEMKQAARAPRNLPALLSRPALAKPPARDSGMAITGLVAGMAVHFATRCRGTALSALSPPARGSPFTPGNARRWKASPRPPSASSTWTGIIAAPAAPMRRTTRAASA